MKTNKVIYNVKLPLNSFADRQNYDLYISDKVELKKNHWYYLRFASNTSEEQPALGLLMNKASQSGCTSKCYISGKSSDEHVSAIVYTKK